MHHVAVFACAVMLVFIGIIPSHAEKRVALVIGNSAYQNTPALPNPKNDATDMAAALTALGFDVALSTDLDKRGMDQAFHRFAKLARDADAALFFYAGHGIQFAGSNYLMPVEAKLQDETDLQYAMAKVDDIIVDLSRAKNTRIVILDACRDNPIAERLRMSLPAGRSAAVARGLARIERTQGLITAFAILKYIATPDIEATTLFRRVAQEVNHSTEGKQLPEISISLLGDFYFAGQGPPAASAIGRPPSDEAAQAWAALKDPMSLPLLEAFIKRYADSFYADIARARLEELKKAQVTVTPKMVAPTADAARPMPKPSGGCFTFNGRQVCE
jgi:uncharacterized caspase-like protein